RGGQADRLGHRSRHQCPRPRHAHRALALAGADVGADHRDQRRAEAEDQRDLEIFEAHAHAVAGEREGAERPYERGEDDDGQVRQDVVHEAGRADAQDLAEELAPQPHRRQAHEAAARAQVTQEDEAAERVVRHHGEAGAGDAQARQSGEAEDQRGRQRDEDRAAAEGDHGRQHHVAGAAIAVWLFNTLASVVRGTGNMVLPAVVTLGGGAVLVTLSPALIFGLAGLPRLGITGAGLAVVAYYALGSLVFLGYLRAGRSLVRL